MSRHERRPHDRGWAAVQAGVAAATFSVLLAGSNAINPLLPVYRDLLGLDAIVLSATFSVYVGVLVVALFALSRPRFTRHAPVLLLTSLVVMFASDLLLVHEQEWSILLGRGLCGVAGGLGTGAVSALVVAAVGSRGRAVTATGNAIGAVLGVAASQSAITLLDGRAPTAVFSVHAGIVGVLLIASAVVLHRRRRQNSAALGIAPTSPQRARVERATLRFFATGAVTWSTVSVEAVFGAIMFGDLHQPLVRAVGPPLMLLAVASAQLGSPALARVLPWASGLLALGLGAAGTLAAAWLHSDTLAIAGFVVLGAGAGIAYRTPLVTLTRDAVPAQQGALASMYAAVTYTASATLVLAVGFVGAASGLVTATVVVLVPLALLALVSLAWAPRLGGAVERPRPAPAPRASADHPSPERSRVAAAGRR